MLVLRDNNKVKELFKKIINDSIKEVSEEFMTRRELTCDIDFGRAYSEIH